MSTEGENFVMRNPDLDPPCTQEFLLDLENSTASFATSRRNFLSAAATGGTLVTGSLLVGWSLLMPNRASAQGKSGQTGPLPGCSPSNQQPNKCCFLAGTKIQTPCAETAIESLKIGDLVRTISNDAKPIKWIGRLRFKRDGHRAWDRSIAPVKIARGALDGHRPWRDLYITESHSLYINGYLVPAKHLINGRSILYATGHDADVLEYFHIELSDHDAVYAEGAPAETYLPCANRALFDNCAEHELLYGSTATPGTSFAPIVALGGRQELPSRLRSILSPVYDFRRPTDIIRDEIADRAERHAAA